MDVNAKQGGWNRQASGANGVAKKVRKSAPSALRGVLALLIVVAIGVFAIWLFKGDHGSLDGEGGATGNSQIKEVNPSVATSANTSEQVVITKSSDKQESAVEEPVVNSRKAPSTAKKYPRRVIPRKPEPPQRFKYDSDDLIAGFLEIMPGDQIEAGLRFDRIGRDFEASLSEDVALAEGQDNEENQELRKWVRETKEEIKQVMKSENKTFGQVMQEQFDQLIALGQYKQDLQNQLRDIRKSGEYTADEYAKFVEASNAMLRGKGCSELKVPKATFYQVELYKLRREAKDALGLEKETKESKAAAIEAMNQGE